MSDAPSIQEQKYSILLNSYADLFEEVQKLKTWISLIVMVQSASIAALISMLVFK